ncbi:MAG: AsmA family protein [Verrucomicrobiae bacterium]|nr:AsmA family protein [Verrucomicrobiae bacterium]
MSARGRFPFFRALRQLVALAVLAAVAAAAWLHFHGLPGPWRDAVVRELDRQGVALTFASLRWDLFRGLVARQVAYVPPGNRAWRVRMETLALNVNLPALVVGRLALNEIAVEAESVALDPGDGSPPLAIRRAEAEVKLAGAGRVELRHAQIELPGLQADFDGRLLLVGAAAVPPESGPRPAAEGWRAARLWMDRFAAFRHPLRVRLRGSLDATDFAAASIEGSLDARPFAWDVWRAGRVHGKIVLRDGLATLQWFSVETNGGRATLWAEWPLRDGPARFEFSADLLPGEFVDRAEAAALGRDEYPRIDGRVEARLRGALDPQAESVWRSLEAHGELAAREVSWRNESWQAVHLDLRLSNGVIEAPRLFIAQGAGRLIGSASYRPVPAVVNFDVTSTLDVARFMRLLYPRKGNWFHGARFTRPPLVRLAGSWAVRDPNGLRAKGDFDWQDWLANEVPIRSAKGRAEFEGRRFAFLGVDLRRAEGGVAGDFTLDFAKQTAEVALTSSVEFAALCRILGPKTEEIFRDYRFLTPPKVKWKGVLALNRNQASDDFEAQILHAGRFAVWKLEGTNLAATVRFRDKGLEIAQYRGGLYGGILEGDAAFDFSTPRQDWAFRLRLDRVDFEQLTRALWNYEGVQGRMSGAARMSGTLRSSSDLRGSGRVTVAEGVLWRIPLFGELSKFIPVLGTHTARKAEALFTVSDERVHVTEMDIEAGLLSLTAKGNYKFDTSLDFIVQGHFLRTLGIGYLFDPLTKPFEYHLGGKLNARVWKPRFIPKELLLQFGDAFRSGETNAPPASNKN